jgi:hypothetical protein
MPAVWSAGPAEPAQAQRWAPEQGVVVEVSGQIRDPETGAMQPCVSVRVAGYVAHHLSHVLADWTAIGALFESGRGADETALAAVLHDAATSVKDPGACRCKTPVEPALGAWPEEAGEEGEPLAEATEAAEMVAGSSFSGGSPPAASCRPQVEGEI